jgi:hypothetical protein
VYQIGTTNSFRNDMFNGRFDTAIVGGINATPQYASGNGWQSEAGGMYQLAAGTPGHDGGVRIANFNDGFLGNAPDVGAAEAGSAAMKFGVAAATSSGTTAPASSGTPTAPTGPSTSGSGTASASATMDASVYSLKTGDTVTLTAAFMGNSGVPTGTVSFLDSGAAIAGCGAVAISAGKATCTTNAFAAGSHPVTGSYSGDSTYGKATAGPITLSVTAATTAAPTATTTGIDAVIAHYYQAILRRAPDPSGANYWKTEAARMQSAGANINEVFYAMAMTFFASGEYAALGRNNEGYVTDLYSAFFDRGADAGGVAYWAGQLASGMPRDVLLLTFMFSPEFTAYMQSMLSNTPVRVEIDTMMDFFRGLLARLPDDAGYTYWLQQFRTAQCQGAGAVYAQVDAVTNAFLFSTEYALRNRTNAQFVGDMYNALLRRGGDLTGVQYWIGLLDRGLTTRDAVRKAFIATPEFTRRVNAIVAQGCAG